MNNLMTTPTMVMKSDSYVAQEIDVSSLDHFLKTESFQYKSPNNYNTSYAVMTPYNHSEWKRTVIRLGVTMPFQSVITKDMGKSKCHDCGAIYAGQNPEGCVALVRKSNRKYNDWKFVGDSYPGYSEIKVCGSHSKWDLEQEFNKQADFFKFLDMISPIGTDIFDRYIDTLPADKVDEYRIKMLLLDLVNTQQKVHDMFCQIANKMNNAGVSLQW